MALSWAKRKFASATTMRAATSASSPLPRRSAPKRYRSQSPGVTNPLRFAMGRSFGTRAWNSTMIDIMKPVDITQEKPRR